MDIKFNADGLVPAIAVDAYTNEVLMQAYMNREAYEKTLQSGEAYYYSRSRKQLWRKGETSGHTQKVVDIRVDCDADSVLLRVIQTGAACHTGERSCFYRTVKTFEEIPNVGILQKDFSVIADRREHPIEGSYTNYLLNKGVEKICKKVGEEASESIIAAMKHDNEELACELADLYYHTMVLMLDRGIALQDVWRVLETRNENERKRNY
ncbi:MAG: bifunctional phosphoribosyl-AMP cyclohydrolase/phosphoribosyl-ATP diphosphatase HisIE [Clostridiales bacterium]|nr:bifunctional phosphoribosyl-AMP cyclohydrolase/phosphoribosyl-ATP diphosphatase HisIE [Clostridiales bacterium]